MVEWRQASSFQDSLLVLVPSGGGVTWGEMGVWRAPLPGVRSCSLERYSKFGVRIVCRFRFLAKRDQFMDGAGHWRRERDTLSDLRGVGSWSEGENVLLQREMNGKTCQWNTRRESVNKQNRWLTLSGIGDMTVGGGAGYPSCLRCLSKLTNVGIHACTQGPTHVSHSVGVTRTSRLLSKSPYLKLRLLARQEISMEGIWGIAEFVFLYVCVLQVCQGLSKIRLQVSFLW